MSTLTAFDFLNQAEKELYRFLEKNLSKEHLSTYKKKIESEFSFQAWVTESILCYDPTPLTGNIEINFQTFPNSISGKLRNELIQKMLACLPFYTPEYQTNKQAKDLEACENYLTHLKNQWRAEGGKPEILQAQAKSNEFSTTQNSHENNNLNIISQKYKIIYQAKENLKNYNPVEFKKTLESLKINNPDEFKKTLENPGINKPAGFKKALINNFDKLNIKRDTQFNQFLKYIGLYEKFYNTRFNLFGISKESRGAQLITSLTQFQTPKMAF